MRSLLFNVELVHQQLFQATTLFNFSLLLNAGMDDKDKTNADSVCTKQ